MPRWNLYAIDINYGRNYYNCRGFGHIVRNCRNQKIIRRERRLKYRNNKNSNLNGKENLIVLD